ncbi:MAG: hypothetical protein AAFX50_10660, partial [Acidobacteriota bacterium]
ARRGSTTYRGRYSIDFRSPLSMSTDITFDGGRIEDVIGMFVDLEGGLTGNLVGGSLVFDGPLYRLDGRSELTLSDVQLYGEQFATGSGRGFLDDGRFTLDDLRLRREGGRGGLTLRGSVDRQWALDMQLVGDGLRLENLDRLSGVELPMSGRLALRSRITNTLFDPSPDGRIWVTDVRYAGEPVEEMGPLPRWPLHGPVEEVLDPPPALAVRGDGAPPLRRPEPGTSARVRARPWRSAGRARRSPCRSPGPRPSGRP